MTLFYVFKDLENNRCDWRVCDQYGQPPIVEVDHEVGWVVAADSGWEAAEKAARLFE